MNIDIEPLKLAKWLQITLNQRKRAKAKSDEDFGNDSAASLELTNDAASIQAIITYCLNEQAKRPKQR